MSDKEWVEQSFHNFERALASLIRFISMPIESDRDRAGIIQAFEYTYELAWKTIKRLAEAKGLSCPTPLDAFRAAATMGLIETADHNAWLAMKESRNKTSHTYQEALAEELLEKIKDEHVGYFVDLLTAIKLALATF